MSFSNLAATDIVISNDGITAPAWASGTPTLTSASMFTYGGLSVAPQFYTDVYYTASTLYPTPQFSVSYGQISGSGAALYNTLIPNVSPTKTTYNQFRNLVYADENTSFNFGQGNTSSPDIYVISVNRESYKESLFPGTFNLKLTVGSDNLHLTNNSNDVTTISYLDCGRVYDIVSGSNGNATLAAQPTTTSGSYGLFLPDVGLVILNPRALSNTVAAGGLALNPNLSQYNQTLLVDAIKNGSFTLNSYETISSDYVFVRVPNGQFNYTTNPSIISGSGALLHSTMINNPQSYITAVGLYNNNQELLAVAKLSKPLVKDFTKEALIQVKLNF